MKTPRPVHPTDYIVSLLVWCTSTPKNDVAGGFAASEVLMKNGSALAGARQR